MFLTLVQVTIFIAVSKTSTVELPARIQQGAPRLIAAIDRIRPTNVSIPKPWNPAEQPMGNISSRFGARR